MKIYNPYFQSVFDFSTVKVQTVIIEGPHAFSTVIGDIASQIEGNSGETVLSEDDEPIEMNKYAEILDRFYSFDINRKSLLSKISDSLLKRASDEEHFLKSRTLLSEITAYLENLAFDELADVYFTGITEASLLKASGMMLYDDYDNLTDKLLDYMLLVREYERDKLFITVNLGCYLTVNEVNELSDSVRKHGLHLLMIESNNHELDDIVKSSPILTVDDDYCIF